MSPRRISCALRCLALSVGAALALPAAVVAAPSASPGPITPTTITATVTGAVTQPDGARLPGMRVQAQVVGAAPAACTAAAGCFTTYSGPAGAYTLAGLTPATYELSVLDGARTVDVRQITVPLGTTTLSAPLALAPAAVPAGAAARACAPRPGVAAGRAGAQRRSGGRRAQSAVVTGVRRARRL